ncbi:MAG TPA: hypothetical protein VMC41_04585 [Candidatus Nanoarchaeia archaeon]|nr:hypothetical protein [Candidatus Nanoarchaeia archaeon]
MEKFENNIPPQEKQQRKPSPEEFKEIERDWLNKREYGKRINFGEVSFDKEDEYFKIAGEEYPILMRGRLISDPKGPKTDSEFSGFGWIQKENVIPEAYTEFFSRFVEDERFNGREPIYFSKDGFSAVPTLDFITVNNKETGEITGTIKAISSVMKKFFDDNGNLEYEELKFEYLKFLLSKGPVYSHMVCNRYQFRDNSTYFYGEVRLEGDKILAEVLEEGGENGNKYEEELDINEAIYALSSNLIIGHRLIEKINKILSDSKSYISAESSARDSILPRLKNKPQPIG